MLGVAQCLLASPQNVSMAVVSSFAKVSMSRGTTNYILPSLPLLRSLALVQYAIHSNNLNFCYLKLEEEEIYKSSNKFRETSYFASALGV